MHTRHLLFASAALAIAGAAIAEPAKPETREAAPPASRPAEVVLASADQVVQTPPPAAQEQASATPVKRRAARVTTCRCGDQPQR